MANSLYPAKTISLLWNWRHQKSRISWQSLYIVEEIEDVSMRIAIRCQISMQMISFNTLCIIIRTNLKPNFWSLILTILPRWEPQNFWRSGKRISRRFLWAYLQLPNFLCLGDIQKKVKDCDSIFAVTSVFIDYCGKEHLCLYVYNFQTNQARKSRLLRFWGKFKQFQNLTNREFLAWFV